MAAVLVWKQLDIAVFGLESSTGSFSGSETRLECTCFISPDERCEFCFLIWNRVCVLIFGRSWKDHFVGLSLVQFVSKEHQQELS